MVVDIGWAETIVTGIYEYREVSSSRSVRATKLLGKEMQKTLAESFDPTILQQEQEEKREAALQEFMSFEECEEVAARVAWCRPSADSAQNKVPRDSQQADREGELESEMHNLNLSSSDPDTITSIPLCSTNPPRTLHLPFSKLAQPCETALLASNVPEHELDDEELPIHLLLYRSLLRLPLDLRSVCMSRVIFVGGGSHVLGLKGRVMDEVQKLISERGWDPVQGRAVKQFKNNTRLKRNRARQVDEGPSGVEGGELELSRAGFQDPEPDPIEAQIRREAEKGSKPPEQGTLRAVESLGAWAGASLLTQLRVPAVSTIEREVWLKEGMSGANKNADISVAVAAGTRGSMGPGAFNKGAGERISWTLGLWG
jgi:actin-related protein